jgi:hypothetical protein
MKFWYLLFVVGVAGWVENPLQMAWYFTAHFMHSAILIMTFDGNFHILTEIIRERWIYSKDWD